jgi:hypothetical protein
MTDAVPLEHALLIVRGLDATLAWYRHLLPGWTVRWDGRPQVAPWAHFARPTTGRPPTVSQATCR